ncbi:hypothetical protein JD844_013914 [Phrynosoma platyrhinos]|uniref:Ig-like domain-containing protein n=1 Tax=Phrynosoma platyrhinos TaxID=52577 RepID=A0ABQ7TML8_PHRPL|nr:hypothetical protein JD844_013914 [Phrynosoma platyrhinos]
MSSCELRKDGSKRGHYQNAYDGRDFISLDKETLTWTAADTAAQVIKRKVEAEPSVAQCFKAYLEEECIDWLKKYLDYGKEVLLRTETPLGKVTRQAIGGGQEALICQAYGFYPKEIDTTWRKGEEILEHETFRRNIAPNSDGTYHVWLSIKIDPKERDLYQCHVDHASLPTPLVLAFKEPGVNVGFITGIILGVLIVLLVAAGSCFLIIRNRQARAPSSNGPISTQITKRKWDPDSASNQYLKAYLEEECIEWLQKYLDYGKKTLLRTETPVGKVTRQAIGDGQEVLICQAYGFYPKEIETMWRKEEESLEHETFRRDIAPNSDGTYHIWLSIEIDPKERDLYRCHIDHASLPKPLVLAFKEHGVSIGLIVGVILGVIMAAVLLAVGITFFLKNRQKKADYVATSTSDKRSDSSTRGNMRSSWCIRWDQRTPAEILLRILYAKKFCLLLLVVLPKPGSGPDILIPTNRLA